MSAPINDGGPAFAAPGMPAYSRDGVPLNPWAGYGWAQDPQPGMSLRDWFAGQETLGEWDHPESGINKTTTEALAGEPQPESGWGGDIVAMFKFEAKWRAALKYIRADAMIAARAKAEGRAE